MTDQVLATRFPRKLMSTLSGVLVGSTAILGVPPAAASPGNPARPLSPESKSVNYELTVTGTVVAKYVTYQINNNEIVGNEGKVRLPWSMQFSAPMPTAHDVNPYSLSAQGLGDGTIMCTVSIDGEIVSRAKVTGDPPRAVCVRGLMAPV